LGVLHEASHISKEKSPAKKYQQRIARLINGCRQRRVKWNKENKIIIGTRNVRTLLPLGRPKNRREDDIRNEMKKLKMKNWTNCIQDHNNWKLYVEKSKTFKD
jgi:hypothetical protein